MTSLQFLVFQTEATDEEAAAADSREWTPIHLEAAGIVLSSSIKALSFPQNEQMDRGDVDVRGPGE